MHTGSMDSGAMIAATDEIKAAQAGDAKALEAVLRRCQPKIYRFGMNMCGHPQDAEEVAQQLPQFRGEASLSTWLFRIARSFCIKERRRSKFAPAVEESLEEANAPEVAAAGDPEQALANDQMGHQLRRGLALLEANYREVLVLRDVQGLSTAEVAEVLELSPAAVKSRLHRGRAALREHMEGIMGVPAPLPGCPDLRVVFSKHLEGELDAAQCAAMEAHLEGCPSCRRGCDCIKETFALCRREGERSLGPETDRAVRLALEGFLAGKGCPAP